MNEKYGHSEEFYDVAQSMPGKYTTYVIYGLFLFVLSIFIMGFLVEVPERVYADAKVMSSNPPITLNAQISGKIHIIANKPSLNCRKGQYLAVIENPANYKDVLALKSWLGQKDIWSKKSIIYELLENSNVFRSTGGHTFGTHQAAQLQKTLEGGDFFGVDHKIELHDGTIVTTFDQLSQVFDAEKARILNNADLKKVFDKITKAADANGEVRNFKNVLIANPALIVELGDFEEFRKKTWKGYLSDARVRQNLLDYNAFYQSQKAALQSIIAQAVSVCQEFFLSKQEIRK